MPNFEINSLIDWQDIADEGWPSLLIGNGLSINIWGKFAYEELLTRARLNVAAAQMFSNLQTVNFEEVLESLWHAERVAAALNQDGAAINALYAHVRLGLVDAVRRVHIPWSQLSSEHLRRMAMTLDQYRWVFTLNYDLLTYWALMNNLSTTEIVDFLWNNPFDSTDTDLRSASATGLMFLHGGIHLWRDTQTGDTGKWTNQQQGGLLSQFGDTLNSNPNRLPLIVSEGRSEQKQRAIRRSEYLSSGYKQLSENVDPIVIFGASFGPQDRHIAQAIRKGGRRKVAVSVYPAADPTSIVRTKAAFQANLPDQDLFFFDSTTYPLGDAGLRVAHS